MAWYAEDSFDPISISAVPPGWRAVYSSGSERGYHTIPLIGWAVFRVSVRGRFSGAEELPQGRNVIEGVVIDNSGTLVCAVDLDGFWRYLSPDEPDPETIDPDAGRKPVRPPPYTFEPAGAPTR